jgi:sugar lactone lactonase YvrE
MFGNDLIKGWTRRTVSLFTLAVIVAMGLPFAAKAGTNVPPVVITNSITVNASGLATNQAAIALDACGNIYTIASPGGVLSEIPAGGGTLSTILTGDGINYDVNSLWIDATKSNLYVTEGPYNVYKFAITNCVLQTSSQTSFNIGNLGAVSYYWSASAVAADAAGDVFIGTNVSCCSPANELLEENATSSTGAVLLGNLANPIVSIAVDSSNNIYYASGGGLYELTYGSGSYSSTPIAFGSGYTSVVGVSFDAAGNLYVADQGTSGQYAINGYYPPLYLSSTLYVIPNESGVLNPADQYIITAGSGTSYPVTLSSAVAIDPSGNLYSVTGSTSIYETTRDSANLGSEAVAGSGTGSLNVVFNADETPASFTATGVFSNASTGSCSATSYTPGNSCTVNLNFVPTAPGAAFGVLVLADKSGNTLASANLSGTGLGAGLTSDPGAFASIGSGYKTPNSVALDAAGDIFIADSSANAVWEIAVGGTTPVSIGSGLKNPQGIAVDGAGNVYVADTGNNRIVEIPVVSGAVSTSALSVLVSSSASIAGSTLSSPAGVSTDAQGNLYIADTGNNRIVDLPHNEGWNLASAFTIGSGFSSPLASTVTASGLIYIADSGNGKIYSAPFASSGAGLTLVATGFNDPSALATDASGSLYVVDQGNMQVSRIPNVSGSLATASVFSVSTDIASPYGLAINPDGNLYVTDSVNALVYSVSRTNSSQSFGKWGPTTTSSALSYLIESAGNQSLTLNSPYYTSSGDIADFTESASSTNPCAAGGILAVGADCSLSATFTPPSDGSFSESLTFSSNATNGSVQQAAFTGIGATVATTTTALSVTSPSGSPYYGQAIDLSVSVVSVSGTPVGTVALQVDGTQAATTTLTNGIGTFSLANGLSGGSHTLQAIYEGGDTTYVTYGHSSSAVQTINVSTVSTTTTVAFTTQYSNPSSQPACPSAGTTCTGLSLTATVTPSEAGIPTGNVTFTITQSNGTIITQSVPLTAATGGLFQASYTYDPSAPASGSNYYTVSVQAAYAGDTNFSGSTSAASAPFYVSPAGGSVVVSASSASLTASVKSSSTITFTPTSYGGWSGLIGFGCVASSLPANTRCVFSPGQIQVAANTTSANVYIPTVTVTVTVDQPPQTPTASSLVWWFAWPAGLLLFFARKRFARAAWAKVTTGLGIVFVAIAIMGLGACSNASFVTPNGNSTITVYADSSPYTAASVAANSPVTTTCPADDPTNAPCSQQTFQINLAVQ